MPIDGVDVESMKGGFAERRGCDGRTKRSTCWRRATRRSTPSKDGTIAKLFVSKAGGITIYQFDPAGSSATTTRTSSATRTACTRARRCRAGDVIGYVGTTGNAPPNTPHLHFAVFELNDDRQWWKGRAIDPYPLFKSRSGG